MMQAFVMVLREGFESFLIVAIVLSYLRQIGQEWLAAAVYWAVGTALVLSVGLGLRMMDGSFSPVWEGILGVVTILMVGSLVIHMWRIGDQIAGSIRSQIGHLTAGRSKTLAFWGVFAFCLIMVVREGIETVLLLLQVPQGDVVGGLVLGLLSSVLMAWLWARYGPLVNVKRFFQVTGVFLILFMAQVALSSFHEFSEGGVLPNSEAIHEATEPFSPVGLYGQWFSPLAVGACALWLMVAALRDRLKTQKTFDRRTPSR